MLEATTRVSRLQPYASKLQPLRPGSPDRRRSARGSHPVAPSTCDEEAHVYAHGTRAYFQLQMMPDVAQGCPPQASASLSPSWAALASPCGPGFRRERAPRATALAPQRRPPAYRGQRGAAVLEARDHGLFSGDSELLLEHVVPTQHGHVVPAPACSNGGIRDLGARRHRCRSSLLGT